MAATALGAGWTGGSVDRGGGGGGRGGAGAVGAAAAALALGFTTERSAEGVGSELAGGENSGGAKGSGERGEVLEEDSA